MPTFKSSRDIFQSFNWNNQGYQILNDINKNPRFKTLRLLKTNFRFRYHREKFDTSSTSFATLRSSEPEPQVGSYTDFSFDFLFVTIFAKIFDTS